MNAMVLGNAARTTGTKHGFPGGLTFVATAEGGAARFSFAHLEYLWSLWRHVENIDATPGSAISVRPARLPLTGDTEGTTGP